MPEITKRKPRILISLCILIVIQVAVCAFCSADGSILGVNWMKSDGQWQPQDAASKSPVAAVNGRQCLRFRCDFRRDTVRAVWDKAVKLDLSDADYIRMKFKVSDPLCVRMFSVYFGTGGDAWWRALDNISIPTDQWQTVVIPKSMFLPEGPAGNWNSVCTIRLSVWQSTPGITDVFVSDMEAGRSDSRNLLPNSGFEIVKAEALPKYWGTWHWGLSTEDWVVNTDLWRAHWGVDNRVRHSGKRSLRIIGTKGVWEMQALSDWINIEPGAEYTMSAWLKSNGSVPVTMELGGIKSQEVTVGSEWKRYVLSGIVSSESALASCIIRPESNGTLWIDDVQIEKGSTPTEWKPMVTDAADFDPAVHRAVPPIKKVTPIPGPAKTTTRIDSHRRFLLNGKPFIPFAPGWEQIPSARVMRSLAEDGFNTICFCTRPMPVADLKTALDNANACGLKVILWVGPNVPNDMLKDWVVGLRSNPALIAWYVFDEPQRLTDEIMAKYRIAKQYDPDHPAYINYDKCVPDMIGDIASMDYYPIPSHSPALTGSIAKCLDGLASEAHKPSWIWLQSTGYAYYIPREPTGPEIECMTYGSLINGVRGIKFFAQKPHSKEAWDEMRMLAREVTALTPILYSLEASPAAKVTPSSISIVAKTYQGKRYVVALNNAPRPISASISISGSASKAKVLFEKRTVPIRNGKIKDVFQAYQRHVYQF